VRPPRRLEKAEQHAGVQLLRTACRAQVYVLGHARPKGDRQATMQSPGLPDVEGFLPRPGGGAVFFKWEVKRTGGRLSPAQVDYRARCLEAGVAHIVGDLDALIAWLIAEGFLRRDQVPYYRLPAAAELEVAR